MLAVAPALPLLSRPEQVLYGRLVRAFPGHIILSHMAISPLITADFVVCKPDFTPIAVVELDEAVSRELAQREQDRRKELNLQAAGLKVIRLLVTDLPDEAALRALVAAHPLHRSTEQLMRRAS